MTVRRYAPTLQKIADREKQSALNIPNYDRMGKCVIDDKVAHEDLEAYRRGWERIWGSGRAKVSESSGGTTS